MTEERSPPAGLLAKSGDPASSPRSGSPSPAAAPSATSRPPPWSGTSLPQVSDTPNAFGRTSRRHGQHPSVASHNAQTRL